MAAVTAETVYFEPRNELDPCIIGSTATGKMVYDYDKLVEVLAKDMDFDEAAEFVDYNMCGLYVGEGTPLIVSQHTDWSNKCQQESDTQI